MRLRPVTKLDKSNTVILKNINDDIISVDCSFIASLPIYDKFEANRKPDSGRMICNAYIFINSNLLTYKMKTELKEYLTQLSYYCFQ